jgi:hypothetical protein
LCSANGSRWPNERVCQGVRGIPPVESNP